MSDGYVCSITGHSPPYVFDLRNANMAELARPTIQDVLEHVAEYHHTDCGCGLKVGTRVWLTSTPPPDAADCESEIPESNPLPVDAFLDDPRASESSQYHLIFSGEEAPSEDHLRRYREKVFVTYCADAARVFKRAGAQPTLPPRIPPSFNALCAIPGSTFVDKSQALHALLGELASWRVGIVRRPKGFGKTAFLSIFDAFFDPYSLHAHLPFTFTRDSPLRIYREHGQLLVYALDFADLQFERGMSDDEMLAECNRLMDAAAHKFYLRYERLLHVQDEETSRPGFAATYLDIIGWAKRQGWKLCFTIDNYTAPVRDGPNCRFELSISQDILDRLRHLVSSRFFLYGLILGDDVPHATQWNDMPTTFKDLTDAPAFAQAIGFTVDEVAALGQAISADLIAALPSGTPTGRYAKRVYAAADIMALARSVTSADGTDEPAPTKVRTCKYPPPVKAVQPTKAAIVASRKRARLEERYNVPLKLFDAFDHGVSDDEGSQCNGDRSLTLPELSEGSSSGSSSSSSDSSSNGSSSAPSSGGDKGRILLPILDEPPSPLDGYAKRPWVLDSL